MAENPRGDCQGAVGVFESPKGINTPRVEELPREEENSRVAPEGDRVLGVDGRGGGGDENSPATRDTEASGDSSSGKEMASGPGPATPQ